MTETPESSLLAPDSARMYATIGTMGTLPGLLAGWLTYNVDIVVFNLHASVWLFLVVWAATTMYFSYRRIPSGVVASGLYLLAWLVFLVPFAYFGPMLAEAKTQPWSDRAQVMLEAFQGLFVWGLAGGVLALLLAGIAVLFRRRTKRLLSRRRREEIGDQLAAYVDRKRTDRDDVEEAD